MNPASVSAGLSFTFWADAEHGAEEQGARAENGEMLLHRLGLHLTACSKGRKGTEGRKARIRTAVRTSPSPGRLLRRLRCRGGRPPSAACRAD